MCDSIAQQNDEPSNRFRSKSFVETKILQQTWKYPHKQVEILLNDDNVTVQHIMDTTQCKIYINKTENVNNHKMVQITLVGTSDEIFNGHKEINYIRQHGYMRKEKEKRSRFNIRNRPKKLINWNLDVSSNKLMLNTVKEILDKSHATNWAIFGFEDNNKGIQNLKFLSIENAGTGGVSCLAKHLSHIIDLKYCLLRFDYGIDIERHQIILIIWSPSTSKHGQKKNIIPILRHKSLIKKILCATYELTISIHSYLNASFILSELYRSNLVPEILLRVTKRKNNDENNNDETKTDKFFASKEWTLRLLIKQLSEKYNMNNNDIQITHILYNVKKRSSKFNSRRQTETRFDKPQYLDKKLSELKLYHGSRLYIYKSNNNNITNSFLAAQRRAQFSKTKILSKTKTIKIKLKLSSHIMSKKIKTLKLIEENKNKNNVKIKIKQYEDHHKSHSMPPLSSISRTRSLSTTLTEGLSKSIMKNIVDKDLFDEYMKPEIFEPIAIINKKWTNKKKISKPLPPAIKQEIEEKEIEEKEKEIENKVKEYKSINKPLTDTTEIECTLDLNEVFIVERSVGRGKTAHVHYAIYKQECDIALKEFRFHTLTDKIIVDFHHELETLKKLDHANIVSVLGHYYDFDSKQLYLAFEWCPCGCLYDIIHDNSIAIEFIDVLEMCLDISRGMKYLHSQNIIHRDLKTHNLLLDEAYRVKITDFGTAKTLDKIGGTAYTEVGTGGYCAPEVIEPPEQGYDAKIDVFSFGVLMWEIYHRKNIFDQRCLRNINQLQQGIRPPINDKCPSKYRQLIQQCWEFDPQKRPNFDQIVSVLLQLYESTQI